MRSFTTLAMSFLFLAFAVGVTPARAEILYSQPWNGVAASLSSQNDIGGMYGNFATAYDSFTLATDASLQSISWTGNYFNPPSPGTISAFTLAIYADASNAPGAQLASFVIPGNANQTSLGSVGGFPFFSYSASLTSPIELVANSKYWLSIVPDMPFPPQWGWANSAVGDGQSYQVFFGSGSSQPGDLAFTLQGDSTTVPEPATGILFAAMGLVGLGYRKWRKPAK